MGRERHHVNIGLDGVPSRDQLAEVFRDVFNLSLVPTWFRVPTWFKKTTQILKSSLRKARWHTLMTPVHWLRHPPS